MRKLFILTKHYLLAPLRLAVSCVLAIYDLGMEFLGVPSEGRRRERRRWQKNIQEMELREQLLSPGSKEHHAIETEEFSRGQVVNHLAQMNRRNKPAPRRSEPESSVS